MILKLADRSTIQIVGFVEDIPIKIEGRLGCPYNSREPFLATMGAIVDVKNGRIVFQVSDEIVGFELENVMKGPALYSLCKLPDHDVKDRFLASSTQYDLFDPF